MKFCIHCQYFLYARSVRLRSQSFWHDGIPLLNSAYATASRQTKTLASAGSAWPRDQTFGIDPSLVVGSLCGGQNVEAGDNTTRPKPECTGLDFRLRTEANTLPSHMSRTSWTRTITTTKQGRGQYFVLNAEP